MDPSHEKQERMTTTAASAHVQEKIPRWEADLDATGKPYLSGR